MFVALAIMSAWASPALAQDVFRWVKADGSVTYTDNLSALPDKLRAEYNAKIAAREAARAELERTVGKDELARREAEAELKKIQAAGIEESDRAERMGKIEARIKQIDEANKQKAGEKAKWQARMRAARANLQKLFKDFQAAEARYNELGTRASFTLLPGQAEELEKAKEAMDKLGPQIDQAVLEIEQKIPDEARRAGIPPGWLRDS